MQKKISTSCCLIALTLTHLILIGCGTGLPNINGSLLKSITITPAHPSIQTGGSQQFTAMGAYEDNSTQDITNSVAWTSSDMSKANISDAGLATAVTAGTLTITATMGLINGSATLEITTQTASLTSITVTPATSSIAAGTSQQFNARGTWDDGTVADLTTASWSSSDATKATIDASGLVMSLATGTVTITAASNGIAGTASIQITPAILSSISVTPNPLVTGVGISVKLMAIGTYSDQSTIDITSSASWSSSTPSVATVDGGSVTGVSLGSTTISAAYGGFTGNALTTVATTGWIWAKGVATDHSDHTATLMSNGKVLVAGGWYNPNTDLYDPATNTWSSAGSMANARREHTATLLSNGKVLVVGGCDGNAYPMASAELYDPATNTWLAAANMATDRAEHTATLLSNGKVLIAGGVDYNHNAQVASAELYDPATNTWSAAGSMTTARSSHTATLLSDGKVLAVGGGHYPSVIASGELYDPATNTWSTAGSMTLGRGSHTATLLPNGNVLVAAGFANESHFPSSAELYDPAANTWTVTGRMVTRHAWHTATLLSNGNVLVAGGGSEMGYSIPTAVAEVFDPATNTWSAAESMTNARSSHTSTLLSNGMVLVVGGIGQGPAASIILESAELYFY